MFSCTVSERKMLRSCGTQPMPSAGPRLGRQRADLAAAEAMRPAEAARHADELSISVVLPTPLRPSTASASPSPSAKRDVRQHDRAGRSRRTARLTASRSAMRGSRRDRPRAPADRLRSPPACPRPAARRRPAPRCARAKLNTRSMSCSISSTDTSAGSAAMASRMSCRSAAGTPAAGSSSSSTRGAQAKATAISSRRCLP